MRLKDSVTQMGVRAKVAPKIAIDDPWAKLAAAVIIQGLLDDRNGCHCWYAIGGDPTQQRGIPPTIYQFYADLIGLTLSYDELLSIFIGNDKFRRWTTATAWLDYSLKGA